MSTVIDVFNRRKKIWAMYLQGTFQWKIAEELEVSESTVANDLRALRKLWGEKYKDLGEQKIEELAKLDDLERESREAWVRSREDKVTEIQEIGPGGQILKTTIQRVGQVGDPRFLAEASKIIGMRCRVLGLEAPLKTVNIQVRWDLVTVEQMERLSNGEPYPLVLNPDQYSAG